MFFEIEMIKTFLSNGNKKESSILLGYPENYRKLIDFGNFTSLILQIYFFYVQYRNRKLITIRISELFYKI